MGNTTFFTVVHDEEVPCWYALVLKPEARTTKEWRSWETAKEAQEEVSSLLGESTYLPKEDFADVVRKRQTHTPELLVILREYSDLADADLTRYVVYGSHRLWSPSFVRGTVAIPCDITVNGWHLWLYVAAPQMLEPQVVDHFDLMFLSRPEEALS